MNGEDQKSEVTNQRSEGPVIGITGARGTLGQSLVRDWPAATFHCFRGDIRNVTTLMEWMGSYFFDAVIHFAAIVPTKRVEEQPSQAFEINVAGTVNFLAVIRSGRFGHFPWIFIASSSHVYAPSVETLSEESACYPMSLYGRTKLQADEWAAVYREKFGMPVCTGRIFSFTAPMQAESFFVPAIIKRIRDAKRNEMIELEGLMGHRDFLQTKQISAAIRYLFTRQKAGVFNIGSGKKTRLFDLADEIRSRLGREDVLIRAMPQPPPVDLVANVSKLRGIGFEPEFELYDLLDEMLPGT
jgi:nucleoside-diphosphate-sugar epimerase